MEVPDWGDAPGQDYPSLSALAEAPTSLNAQKKAKRKRKQQHTHLQALLDEPIHLPLHQTQNEGAGECTKMRSFVTDPATHRDVTLCNHNCLYVLVVINADRHNNKKQKISPDKHANKLTAQVCPAQSLQECLPTTCKHACRQFASMPACSSSCTSVTQGGCA